MRWCLYKMRGADARIGLLACATAALLAVFAGTPVRAQGGRWDQAIAAGERALEARDYDQAEALFQAALDQTAGFGSDDPRKAKALVHMARLYRAQGDFAKPETIYRDALDAAEAAHGADDAEYASYLHEVGGYYHARRKYDLAEEYYKKAFALRVKTLGREHVDVAQSINDLGVLHENQARLDRAEVYFTHALSIREKLLGADHLDTIGTAEHFARLLNKLQQGQKAQELLTRARAVRQERVRRYNSPGEQLSEVYTPQEVRRQPELRDRVEPEYTDEARIARHEGGVLLQVAIDREGRARSFRLLRSLGLGLDEKAVEAIRQWTFRPARKDGRRVAVIANIEIEFGLL